MTTEKTSLWIAKLSVDGKKLMHEFLKYINLKKTPSKQELKILNTDEEALSIIFGRLKLQKTIEELNTAMKLFNNIYKIKLTLIK